MNPLMAFLGMVALMMAVVGAGHIIIAVSGVFWLGAKDNDYSIFATPIIEHGEQFHWVIFNDVLSPIAYVPLGFLWIAPLIVLDIARKATQRK